MADDPVWDSGLRPECWVSPAEAASSVLTHFWRSSSVTSLQSSGQSIAKFDWIPGGLVLTPDGRNAEEFEDVFEKAGECGAARVIIGCCLGVGQSACEMLLVGGRTGWEQAAV